MRITCYAILLLLLCACAQTTPLTGGPKDSNAPAIDSAKTSPYNGQLNYADNEIRMRFKEYIQLKKPSDNILIIPQQTNAPTYTAKNKRLTIQLNDPLIENTTYVITFNGAVQDITEKNDSVFQYVFSTGSYIDSLEVKGVVRDAFKNTPAKQMLIGLYPKALEANFDSIPLKFKPTYLAQSDANGKFRLNYLKGGQYYIFAIADKNKNLKYDPSEAIALVGEQDFDLEPDSIPHFELRSFIERSSEIEIEDVNFLFPGKVEVILSNPTYDFSISSNLNLMEEKTEREDSLIFWLDQNPTKKMRFYTQINGELDTLKPIYQNVPDKVEDVKLTHVNNIVKAKLLPGENLQFTFSEPIKEVDLSGIRFFDADSVKLELDSFTVDIRNLSFETFGTIAHEIQIDSAAIKSVFGRENDTKIRLLFDNEEEDYYGSLIVTMDTTFSEPVLMHLLDTKGEMVDSTSFSPKVTFEKLLPGDYQLRLIFDVDESGDWTTGSLKEGREPERVIYNSETVKVKSKWEKEIDWVLQK